MAGMATTPEPGEPRRRLDRPPGERYATPAEPPVPTALERLRVPLAVIVVGVLAIVLLGGPLTRTVELVVLSAIVGLLNGLTVRPPLRAAVVALATIALGLLGVWLFARWEGGVLGPLEYLIEVEGILLPIQLLVAPAVAAAASK
jgi:hypothetical protein